MSRFALLLAAWCSSSALAEELGEVTATPGGSEHTDRAGQARVGSTLPSFAAYDLNGQMVRSMQVLPPTGAPTVLTFFATWCLPCREGLPVLQEVVSQHEGWQLVVVAYGEPLAVAQRALGEVAEQWVVVHDAYTQVGARLGIDGTLPRTYVVGADGVVRGILVAEGSDLAEVVEGFMDPSAPPPPPEAFPSFPAEGEPTTSEPAAPAAVAPAPAGAAPAPATPAVVSPYYPRCHRKPRSEAWIARCYEKEAAKAERNKR